VLAGTVVDRAPIVALPTAIAEVSAPLAGVSPDPAVARYAVSTRREPHLSRDRLVALLRKRVRYVFVIYQENRSFDSYFGTFPGAEGLFSHPASQTPGFNQPLLNTDGTTMSVHPFRIGPKEYAADTGDVGHSHTAIVSKMDLAAGVPRMDRFALAEEKRRSPNPTLQAKQFGELEMAYEDGDTIPLLWRYANRFVLFDRIFQLMTGPSTPGNLAILGAQTGATQWMLHPDQAVSGTGDSGPGVPVLNDANPFWGSRLDMTVSRRMPYRPLDLLAPVQRNLTYATLPLTLAGRDLGRVTRADRDPASDLDDVKDDVAEISGSGKSVVPWGWYEEGFGREAPIRGEADGSDPIDADGMHASYVTHHNGPQYFGYIANNPSMAASLHGLSDFYTTLTRRSLPASGGVFYIKGGRNNLLGLKPADPDPAVQKAFRGDDDHPGYSDAQISEAHVAETVNAIARSPYWNRCAIVLTWDDCDGMYDHVPPPIRSAGPDGTPITDGPRVPLIVISPYARTHTVAHDPGDHASVVKLVDLLFDRKPLADLPDERKARALGEAKGLHNEGPFDDRVPGIADLLSAFDPARLTGVAPPLPVEYAAVPDRLVRTLPQAIGYGWRQVGVIPVDYRLGIRNEVLPDFSPRPGMNSEPAR